MEKIQVIRHIISVQLFRSLKHLETSEELPSLQKRTASTAVSLQGELRHHQGRHQSTAALKSLLDPAQALAGSHLEVKL